MPLRGLKGLINFVYKLTPLPCHTSTINALVSERKRLALSSRRRTKGTI
ncbi:hypothetical protein [Candidatus Enterovibrio altilux]|nr:hypothetical protein [Candidatus Enterovibrio luxaltus]